MEIWETGSCPSLLSHGCVRIGDQGDGEGVSACENGVGRRWRGPGIQASEANGN